MLFYVKRSLPLEIAATLLLGGIGYWGIHSGGLTLNIAFSPHAVLSGLGGALWLTLWAFLVRHGSSIFKGEAYPSNLTASLAKEYTLIYFRRFMARLENAV
jgi:hypothetical protein